MWRPFPIAEFVRMGFDEAEEAQFTLCDCVHHRETASRSFSSGGPLLQVPEEEDTAPRHKNVVAGA